MVRVSLAIQPLGSRQQSLKQRGRSETHVASIPIRMQLPRVRGGHGYPTCATSKPERHKRRVGRPPCVVGAGGSVAVQELRLPLAGGLFVRGARRSTQYSVQCPRGRSHGLRKASSTNKVAAPAGCYPPPPVRQGRVGPRGSEGGFLELLRWSNTIFTAGFYDWSDKDGERNGRQQNFCSSVGARDTKQWG
jgi:hypothetical protein